MKYGSTPQISLITSSRTRNSAYVASRITTSSFAYMKRGITLHIDDGELAARQPGLAVGGFHDRLVAFADRHLHRAAGAFERHVLERRADLLVRGLLAAIRVLRLLPRELHAEECLRHLIG